MVAVSGLCTEGEEMVGVKICFQAVSEVIFQWHL